MVPLILANTSVQNLPELISRCKAWDGKTLLELETQATPSQADWKVHGQQPQPNGATITLRTYLDTNGNSQKVQQARNNGSPKAMPAKA